MKNLALILVLFVASCANHAEEKSYYYFDKNDKTIRKVDAVTSGDKVLLVKDPDTSSEELEKVMKLTNDVETLRKQLAQCWTFPVQEGVQYQSVQVALTVGKDRRVMDKRIVDQKRYKTDKSFRLIADQAMKAFDHPKCEVLDLPPNDYKVWREMVVSFNPNDRL